MGVTGNIACGKSLVLSILAELGAETIDADRVYHELIQPNQPLWQALRDYFGDSIVAPSGAIDRRVLGRIVFSDPTRLADLDALTHPVINAELRNRIAASHAAVIAVDAVKLIESGFNADCDQVWLVTCDLEQQITRLMARNRVDRTEAERRVAAQTPIDPKLPVVDAVINNSGSEAGTRRQVETAWNRAVSTL